jgi:N-acetylglucosaminyldiphosphoundecaprenol N-acetyl-beta-D-mannosaminyltransferase
MASARRREAWKCLLPPQRRTRRRTSLNRSLQPRHIATRKRRDVPVSDGLCWSRIAMHASDADLSPWATYLDHMRPPAALAVGNGGAHASLPRCDTTRYRSSLTRLSYRLPRRVRTAEVDEPVPVPTAVLLAPEYDQHSDRNAGPVVEPCRPEAPRDSGGRRSGLLAVIEVGGVPFERRTLSGAVAWLADAGRDGIGISVRLANAYCVALASREDAYLEVLRSPHGINFPDGTPVVWFMNLAAKTRFHDQSHRVRGPSLFVASLEELEKRNLSVFFLGAAESTLDRMVARAREEYPRLRVAGTYSPPFREVDGAYMNGCAEAVEKVGGADVIFIGLSTPKQDFLSTEIAGRLGAPCVGVGAAFDFYAKAIDEAPVWVQRSAMEWLYRLIKEPRRLWRRYLIGNAQFVIAAVGHASKPSSGRTGS